MAAVADGLGSASLAHFGAQRAVEAVLDALTEQLDAGPLSGGAELEQGLKAMMTEAFAVARAMLERYAADQKVPLRELGTTLLAAACGPDWLLTGHIGDGAIIGYWAENGLLTMSKPERGEYANVTMPLTMDGAMKHVRAEYRPEAPLAVVLMSDGLQSLALNTRDDSPYEGFLRPLIEAVNQIGDDEKARQSLIEFLESERVNARTDDDKTLVVISRAAAGTPADTLPWQAPVVPPPAPRSPSPPKPPEEKSPSVLQAEKLEKEALALDEQARQLEEKAKQLFAIDHKEQFKNTKKIHSNAQNKRKKADSLRQKAKKLRAASQ